MIDRNFTTEAKKLDFLATYRTTNNKICQEQAQFSIIT